MKKYLLAALMFLPSLAHSAFTTDWLRNTSSSFTVAGTTYTWQAGTGGTGQFLQNVNGVITSATPAGGGGGGGASSLAVGTGTASNFTNNVTSPTAAVSFLGSQFSSVASGTTNFMSLNQSSVTLEGKLIAGSNITLTPGAGTLTIASSGGGGGGSSIYPATSTAFFPQGLTSEAPSSSLPAQTVSGAASQTANLMEFKDNSGTLLAGFGPQSFSTYPGFSVKNGTIPNLYLETTSTSDDGFGPALFFANSTSGALWQFFMPSLSKGFGAYNRTTGQYGLYVNASNQAIIGSQSSYFGPSISGQLDVVSGANSRVALVVKGSASQSANLLETQNNSGTAVFSVDPSGIGNFSGALSAGSGSFVVNNGFNTMLWNGGKLGWSSSSGVAPATTNFDIAMARNAAGIMEVNNGTVGSYAALITSSHTATGTIYATKGVQTSTLTITGLTSQACLGTDGSGNVQAGTCSGGGGGASSLEVFSNFSGTRSSPTASIGLDNTMKMSVSGSTAVVGVALDLTISTITTNALYLKDTAGGSIKALVDYEDFGVSGGEITLNMDNGSAGPEQLVLGSTNTNTKNIVFNGQNTGVMSFDDTTEVLNWNKKLSVDSDVTFGTTQGFQYDSSVSSVTVAGDLKIGDNFRFGSYGRISEVSATNSSIFYTYIAGTSQPWMSVKDDGAVLINPGAPLISFPQNGAVIELFDDLGSNSYLYSKDGILRWAPTSATDQYLQLDDWDNTASRMHLLFDVAGTTGSITFDGSSFTSGNHFNTPSLAITALPSENCLGTDPSGNIQAGTCGGGGGGGSSSLAVATGSTSGYSGVPTSSPTAVILFSSSTFTSQKLTPGATVFIDLSTHTLTLSQNFTITDDGDWSNEMYPIFEAPVGSSVTITQINVTSYGVGTSTVGVNFQQRAFGSLATAGTNVFSSTQQVTNNGARLTSFANATLAPESYLVFTTTTNATTGIINLIKGVIHYRKTR